MKYRTFIITAGNLTAAKAKLEAKGQDGRFLYPGLVGSFQTALNGTGTGAPTRYVSSGLFSPEEAAYMEANMPQALDVSDGTTTVIIDGVPTVVPEGPHALLARLGLKIISPPL